LNYHKSLKYAEMRLWKKKKVNFLNVSLVAVQNVVLTWVLAVDSPGRRQPSTSWGSQLPTTPVVQAEGDAIATCLHKMSAIRLFKFSINMALFIDLFIVTSIK
jgi:hypothetical protein